jgi:rhodanese-related sulfurtransferase
MLSLFLFLAFIAACNSNSAVTSDGVLGRKVAVEGGEFTEISIPEFQVMLEEKDFLLVNVHIPLEGNLPNTDTSFPFNEIQQNLSLLPEDKDAKILLYCRSDNMSGIAAEELVVLGYTNIWNLDGGYKAWIQAGLPFDSN